MKTGAELKSLRVKKGIKATYVAAKLNLSRQYLSMLEADKRGWCVSLTARYLKAIGE